MVMINRPEPQRVRPDDALSHRMSVLARRHTGPEVALRRELHRRGLRYRVQVKVPGNQRRTIDVAFTRAKIAVFVDGCFWHGCPDHGVRPATNREWWEWKIERNIDRDANTDELLQSQGWLVLRFWEHTRAAIAAEEIEGVWRKRVDRFCGADETS
jgi:DNA mismatch endonuclease (patch repair protein)